MLMPTPAQRSAADLGMTVRRVAIQAGSTPTSREADVISTRSTNRWSRGGPPTLHALGERGRSALVAGLWVLHSGMADQGTLVERLTEVGTNAGVDLHLSSVPRTSDGLSHGRTARSEGRPGADGHNSVTLVAAPAAPRPAR